MSPLRPRSNQAHAESPSKHDEARQNALLAPQHLPALVAEEVHRHELNERRVDEEARRDGVHRADEDESKGRVGAVEAVGRESKCLADGSPGGSD